MASNASLQGMFASLGMRAGASPAAPASGATIFAHIPEPLYTWRIVPGSTSGEVDAKPYALAAAKA